MPQGLDAILDLRSNCVTGRNAASPPADSHVRVDPRLLASNPISISNLEP